MLTDVEILGAYIPGWLISAALGIVAASLVRTFLGIASLAESVWLPLLAYPAFAVFASGLFWFGWFQ